MGEKDKTTIINAFRPDSPVGTEFLRLFHRLVRGTEGNSARSFLITSATIGEGKSTVASLLALSVASARKKTLLVDADLRRPAVHRLFNLYLEEGITEVVDTTIPLAKAYKETTLPYLSVLTAGRLSKTPTAYFEDGNIAKILDHAKHRFDFIVVDCAPVLPVVDPLLLATAVSGVLLVIKAGETHRELVKQASQVLEKAGAPMSGILLNNMKQVLPYHYGYRYAYEYYRPSPEESG